VSFDPFFTCKRCGKKTRTLRTRPDVDFVGCAACIDAAVGHGPEQPVQWSDKSSVLVFENPKTGQVSYPGRNDRPMPEKYVKAGFHPKRMKHLHEVDKLQRETGVVNQAAHFDQNSLPPCDDR